VTVYSATGLKPVDLFGTLDPYCTFHVNDIKNPELARTSVVENNSNPKWNETHFVLLNNLQDLLCFNILDWNDGRSDSEVGVSTLDLKEVEENNGAIEGLTLPIVRSGKTVGEIKADVRYFPVSVPETKEDGTVVPVAESSKF
jgi:Ca2+-dependent lipid-binding protein